MNRLSHPLPELEEVEVLLEELLDQEDSDLVVFNDDVNTFDHVIKVLIQVCNHSPEQAEQCTLIIHYKGKCAVKKGSKAELKPMCEAILDAGIQAAIV
ncbi:MAG: ATP-dependent Clp protease adaptor ClpS [Cyclobacteriaceae bacterium]|nr:ATP-dependent Clp protease adaptor ClpS [Cyclobacteriaceae bacterium]MDX5466587.1 ATP-dependent Clp protease adaptor ClpS [Cyclobacteriaceae bacterium]